MTASQIHRRITWDLSGSSFFPIAVSHFLGGFRSDNPYASVGWPNKTVHSSCSIFLQPLKTWVVVKMFRNLARKKVMGHFSTFWLFKSNIISAKHYTGLPPLILQILWNIVWPAYSRTVLLCIHVCSMFLFLFLLYVCLYFCAFVSCFYGPCCLN